MTHQAQERDVRAALERVRALDGVERVASVIRVEDTEAWRSGSLA